MLWVQGVHSNLIRMMLQIVLASITEYTYTNIHFVIEKKYIQVCSNDFCIEYQHLQILCEKISKKLCVFPIQWLANHVYLAISYKKCFWTSLVSSSLTSAFSSIIWKHHIPLNTKHFPILYIFQTKTKIPFWSFVLLRAFHTILCCYTS